MNDMTPVIGPPSAPAAHALLRERRSVRYYLPEIPATDIIERILVSAGMAPSAHNRQPWRYLVITTPEAKANLAATMGSRLATDRRRDGDAAGSHPRRRRTVLSTNCQCAGGHRGGADARRHGPLSRRAA